MTTRTIVYARFSTEAQRDASIEDQVRVCQDRASREGWSVTEVLADRAISGATTLRPGYQALLALLRSGGTDIILAESLDRFSRDQEHIAALFKLATFAGVRIVTLTEGDVSELHVGLRGAMGALYLKDLAAKTRRGLEGRIRQGRCVGTPPYGYRVVRALTGSGEIDRGLREGDPEKVAIVQRIFRDYASGASAWRIAKTLNGEGREGPGGGIWYDSTIRGRPLRGDGILRNQTYIGRLVWSRRHRVKDPATGLSIRRYSDHDRVVAQQVPHLQIIEQPLWDRVQLRLAAEAAPLPASRSKSGQAFWDRRRPRYLLSGKVFCSVCGRATSVFGKDYFGCRAAKHGGCRNTATIRRGNLESRVLAALGRQLMRPDLLAEFIAAYNDEWRRLTTEASGQAVVHRRERSAIERRIANLVDAIADGRGHASILAKISDLEDQLRRIPTERDEPPAVAPALHPGMAEVYRNKVSGLRVALADGKDPEALEAARALIDKVIISPPETDGDSPGIELVGELTAMLNAAGVGSWAPRSDHTGDTDVLGAFVSSLKVGPGAEPLAFLPGEP